VVSANPKSLNDLEHASPRRTPIAWQAHCETKPDNILLGVEGLVPGR